MGLDEILVQSVQQTIYQFIIFISTQSNQLFQQYIVREIFYKGGGGGKTGLVKKFF